MKLNLPLGARSSCCAKYNNKSKLQFGLQLGMCPMNSMNVVKIREAREAVLCHWPGMDTSTQILQTSGVNSVHTLHKIMLLPGMTMQLWDVAQATLAQSAERHVCTSNLAHEQCGYVLHQKYVCSLGLCCPTESASSRSSPLQCHVCNVCTAPKSPSPWTLPEPREHARSCT